jgi:hypothetical protein
MTCGTATQTWPGGRSGRSVTWIRLAVEHELRGNAKHA